MLKGYNLMKIDETNIIGKVEDSLTFACSGPLSGDRVVGSISRIGDTFIDILAP